MIRDSERVLNYLVRTGLWSKAEALSKVNMLVLDADSLVDFVYKLCIRNHLTKQASSSRGQQVQLYSATLINYKQFTSLLEAFFDSLDRQRIECILVYEGKFMETQPSATDETPCQHRSNIARVVDSIKVMKNYNEKGHMKGLDYVQDHLIAPNLALNIFKQVVRIRRTKLAEQSNKKTRMNAFQAFYSSYPVMAKLAKEFKCPVLTNNAEFIIMDVRAGFILLDSFWSVLMNTRNRSSRASSERVRRLQSAAGSNISIQLHLHSLFTRQHPGLNAESALNIFPLTTPDFLIEHSETLKKIKIFPHLLLESDFKADNDKRKNHHNAANRFNLVLEFLSSKTASLIKGLIRAEALLGSSNFGQHFRDIYNYYSIAFEFKTRLRLVLDSMYDPLQSNYIEWCLANRESTAHFLLSQLCCAVGGFNGVHYNRLMQLEDMNTKFSTDYLLAELKASFMSLFTGNKQHEIRTILVKERHPKRHKSPRKVSTHVDILFASKAGLYCHDREDSHLICYTVGSLSENKKLEPLRPKLDYNKICTRFVNKQDSVKFMNIVFATESLSKIENQKIESLLAKFLTAEKRFEFAILFNLINFCFTTAASWKDKYFDTHYVKLKYHFELAILNLFLYHHNSTPRHNANSQMKDLRYLIDGRKLDEYVESSFIARSETSLGSSAHPGSKIISKLSSSKSTRNSTLKSSLSKGHNSMSTSNIDHSGRQARHLIELFNKSLEAYFELNAFFEYPMIRLNVHLYYNPILVYNLTLLSLYEPKNKYIIRY